MDKTIEQIVVISFQFSTFVSLMQQDFSLQLLQFSCD